MKRSEQANLKCNKNFATSVSTPTQAAFEAAFDMDSTPDTVRSIMEAMSDLMAEYVGGCPAASSWNKKKDNFLKKLNKNLA